MAMEDIMPKSIFLMNWRQTTRLFSGIVMRHGNIDIGFNPNSAIRNIAGICNKERNVFGMMPHPERATSPFIG